MTLLKELFYPTPIYFMDLEGGAELNQFLVPRVYAWRDREEKGIVRSNLRQMGAWHSPTNMHTMPEFELIVNKITAAVKQVYVDRHYHPDYPAHCLNMWVNINPPGGYNRSHTHPGSLWSGVYYVQTPEACGRVIFTDPRPQAEMATPYMASNVTLGAEHWKEVHHTAIAGRLILFPSWLRHEVEPNLSTLASPQSNRISISFNYAQGQKSTNRNSDLPD